jgi:hypothetical protein
MEVPRALPVGLYSPRFFGKDGTASAKWFRLPQDPQKLCPCNLKRFLNGCASHPGQMDDIYL